MNPQLPDCRPRPAQSDLPRTITTDSAGSVVYGTVYTQLLEYIISAELVFYALMAR
jgi:hypothetical protein